MGHLLEQAEALERSAADERVAYFDATGLDGTLLLDVGCGNGYSVAAWRRRGRRAVGVDSSLYRLSRWVSEHPGERPFVAADALALPFRSSRFDQVLSSGMLEHIGVVEEPGPYRVAALPGKERLRAAAVAELLRVTAPTGRVTLDFPNGWFPVDFWHGDRIGAFRLHPVPDVLNPSLRELRRYASGRAVEVLPLGTRLRFRQVSQRWWGRLLAGPVRLFLALLDALPRTLAARASAVASPFLVVRVSPGPAAPARP